MCHSFFFLFTYFVGRKILLVKWLHLNMILRRRTRFLVDLRPSQRTKVELCFNRIHMFCYFNLRKYVCSIKYIKTWAIAFQVSEKAKTIDLIMFIVGKRWNPLCVPCVRLVTGSKINWFLVATCNLR